MMEHERRALLAGLTGMCAFGFLGCAARRIAGSEWPAYRTPGHENDPVGPSAEDLERWRLEELALEANELEPTTRRAEEPPFYEPPAPASGPWNGIACIRNVALRSGCVAPERLRTYLVLRVGGRIAPLVDRTERDGPIRFLRRRHLEAAGLIDDEEVRVEGHAAPVLRDGTICLAQVWGIVVTKVERR